MRKTEDNYKWMPIIWENMKINTKGCLSYGKSENSFKGLPITVYKKNKYQKRYATLWENNGFFYDYEGDDDRLALGDDGRKECQMAKEIWELIKVGNDE